MECPFCTGNPGYHLGYHIEGDYFSCWRCGWHPILPTIAALLKEPKGKAIEIIKNYAGISLIRGLVKKAQVEVQSFTYPKGVIPLEKRHKFYLIQRGFAPEKLEQEWGIMGTAPSAMLGGIDYKHRIFIPIKWEGVVVSFLCRDITGRSDRRYLVCPEARELVNIKKTIYVHPEYKEAFAVVVEGVTDVWKLGREAVGVYGVKYTPAQVRAIHNRFKGGFVLFDGDVAGQMAARKLVADLNFRGGRWFNHCLDKGIDPGGLAQGAASSLITDLKSAFYK